nr:LD29295p [Drosophila melanogaster]
MYFRYLNLFGKYFMQRKTKQHFSMTISKTYAIYIHIIHTLYYNYNIVGQTDTSVAWSMERRSPPASMGLRAPSDIGATLSILMCFVHPYLLYCLNECVH